MGKRLLRVAVGIALFLILTWAAWSVLDLPPVRLLVKYGLPPAGGPTGREVELEVNGRPVRFLEISPGYCHVVHHVWEDEGDLLGRLSAPLGLPLGRAPEPAESGMDEWVEVEEPYWIAPGELHDRPRPDLWIATDGAKLLRAAILRIRAPTDAELHLAAAREVWGAHDLAAMWKPTGRTRRPNLRLYGPGWRGFSGTTLDVWDRIVESGRDSGPAFLLPRLV